MYFSILILPSPYSQLKLRASWNLSITEKSSIRKKDNQKTLETLNLSKKSNKIFI